LIALNTVRIAAVLLSGRRARAPLSGLVSPLGALPGKGVELGVGVWGASGVGGCVCVALGCGDSLGVGDSLGAGDPLGAGDSLGAGAAGADGETVGVEV
jgi:hypothetical protein